MDAVASAQFSALMLRNVMHRDVHIQSTPRMIGQKSVRPKIATFDAHTVGYLCIQRTGPPTPQYTAAHPPCARAAQSTLRRDARHGTLTTDGCDAARMRSGVSRRGFRGAPTAALPIRLFTSRPQPRSSADNSPYPQCGEPCTYAVTCHTRRGTRRASNATRPHCL